jgi:hypothetical protein
MSADLRTLRTAIETLPRTCKYHGEDIEPLAPAFSAWPYREACCDTGVPALRRRRAEEVLARLEALDAAARKPHDDLARTVAGIKAERGES